MPEKCLKSPTEEHKFRFGKCIWCGQEEEAPKKPTIKELMKGTILNGYVEAARVRRLTELPSAPEALMEEDIRVRLRLKLNLEEAKRAYQEFGSWYENVFEPMVPIAQIELPAPWNKLRYEDNKKKISETGKMPPAFLEFEDETNTYVVSDGIHRINAAKDLGYTHVPAVVSRKRTYPPKEKHHSSNLGEFSVCLFCPLCLRDFSVKIEAPTTSAAREAAVGKTVHCPVTHEFTVEPHNITTVQAYLRPAPWEVHPIYKQKFVYVGGAPTPEEMPKPPSWLIGAEIAEEKPLPPDGWRPTGAPTLKQEIPDALNTLIYQQEVRSPKYPEQVYHIQYRRDIFKKFLEEARKINKADKIDEATVYLIEHCPGITTRMISDVLGRGYWTIYRIVAKLLRPETIPKLKTEVEEQAEIEKWVPTETDETIKTLEAEAKKIEKLPKATAGPLWRGQVTLYPMRHKTEEELLEELKHIFTLEHYTPSPHEWEEIKKQMHKQTDAWLKQSILYWIEEKAQVTT